MSMRTLGYVIAAVLGIATMGVAFSAWRAMAEVTMDTNGWIALILGAVGAIALGGGLLALLFISNRKGFDEGIGGQPPRSPHPQAQASAQAHDRGH